MMVGFKPGQLILLSKPYAYVLNNDVRGQRCDFCFQKSGSIKRCNACSFVYYCNRNCQVKAWKESHKMECKFLKSATNPEPDVRLMALIILKLKKYGTDEPFEEVLGRKVTFGTLMSHVEDIKRNEKVYNTAKEVMVRVKELIGEENMPPPDDFLEMFGKMITNYMSIVDAIRTVGSGLYLGGSVFNHSCEPNAHCVNDGTDLMIRAKKYIQKAEIDEVRITYIEELELTQVRQDLLLSQYFFLCQCERCTNSTLDEEMSKTLSDADEYLNKLNKTLTLLDKLKKMKISSSPMNDVCLQQLEELVSERKLSDNHISRVKMLKELYNAYMLMGDHRKALEYGQKLIKPYRLYLGPYHSVLGFHLHEISSLQFQEGKIMQCMANRAESKKILKLLIGEQHPVYKLLFELDL